MDSNKQSEINVKVKQNNINVKGQLAQKVFVYKSYFVSKIFGLKILLEFSKYGSIDILWGKIGID